MKTYDKETISKVIELYTKENKGQAICAKATGLKIADVLYILRHNNIHIRNKQEAIRLLSQNQVKYTTNNNYFSKQSANMAWLMGYIAADGSIAKDKNSIKLGISITDKEILEKIKKELSLNKEIKEWTTKSGHNCCGLEWTSAQHKSDLSRYDIIPQKTFKLKPPYLLEKRYWIDYIRGYFDGDGSVNLCHVSNRRGVKALALRWQICAAIPEVLEWIINYLFEEYNIPKVSILRDKKRNLYYFQYSTNATKRIYKVLYNSNGLYLERKKRHFEEILNEIQSHETANHQCDD